MANPTIGATTPRIQYTATASQTVFSVPFEFLANADLAVYVNGTLKTLTTDYTLTGANTTGGGSLTFVTGRTAGDIVTILSNLAYSRDTNKYTKYGLLPAEVLEADFDAVQVQAKQLALADQFAIRAPLTDTGTPTMLLPAKATRAGKLLSFDSNGNVSTTFDQDLVDLSTATIAAEAAQAAAESAQALAETAQAAAELAEINAETAETNAEAAEANAEAAQAAAELARDTAFVNANVYADTTAGLAAVALGDQFQVVSGDEIIRYREDSGPVATEVARYPAADYVFDRLEILSTLSGYSFALLDLNGHLAIGVTTAGEAEMPGTPTFNSLRNQDIVLSTIEWGITDQDDRLALGINSDGDTVFKGEVVDVPAVANTVSTIDAAFDPTATIDCWGDSLTHGTTSGVTTPYPTALATLLTGRTVNNKGKSGRTSLQIATAFGAVPSILTVNNNTIPSSGSVSITTTENGNFSSKSDFGTISTSGSLFNIPGTLAVQFNSSNPNLAGTSTFTRTTAGTATLIPNRSPFIPTTNNWESNTVVIWAGKNDVLSAYTDPTNYSNTIILSNIQAMIDFLNTLRKRFIVLSVTNSDTEYSSAGGTATTAYNQILDLNYEMAKRWPNNFVDVRKILVNSYNSSLPGDVTAFGRDVIPPSLFQDGLHLNDAGYAIVAQAVANFITARNW